jgi:hypothetical protein
MKTVCALLAILALASAALAVMPPNDVEGIRGLMKSIPGLTNPFGSFKWDKDHPENACSFKGIMCHNSQFPTRPQPVRRISLQSFVDGSLPESIGLFSNLTSITLWSSGISGTFPASFRQLTQLQDLAIWSSLLTGDLPDIMTMPDLWSLRISSSLMDGTLPAAWSNHPGLSILNLDENALTGTIPDSWNSNGWSYLTLSENKLTGPVPNFLGSDNLVQADLSVNKLSGPLPAKLGARLNDIDFGSNAITGTIPNWNLEPNTITSLVLRNNSLEGPIPDIFGPSSKWATVDLSYNKLIGTIPPSLSSMHSVLDLKLNNNQLALCPAPKTFKIGWAGKCNLDAQTVKPPCSCMAVYEDAGCEYNCA